jgi:tRNA_anti-like
MTPKRKKIILFLVSGIVAIGAAFAFYLFNKGPLDVKNANGIEINAYDLYQTYFKDSLLAVKKYSNKIVETTGVVAQVTLNQQNQRVVLMMTKETGAFINCTMEDSTAVIKEDKTVKIKGICTGIGMGDADMGILGDVYLSRCYLVK